MANVLLSDESKFNVFGSDGKKHTWQRPNQELKILHVRPTVKHGRVHVMVWGCVACSEVGKVVQIHGNMTADGYVSILRDNLKSRAENLGTQNSLIFQKANDPKHSAKKTKAWLLQNVPIRLHTLPTIP